MSALAPLWPLGHSPKGLAVSSATSLPVPKVHQAFGKQITEQNGPRLDSPCPWKKVSRAGRLLGPVWDPGKYACPSTSVPSSALICPHEPF